MSEIDPSNVVVSMNTATEIVRAAIRNTDPIYYRKLCDMRAEVISTDCECCGREGESENPHRQGSFFDDLTPEEVESQVGSVTWEEYDHPAVAAPARAYISRAMGGTLGVVRIEDVPDEATLYWSDPKDTGKVELVWDRGGSYFALPSSEAEHVVILIGPDNDGFDCVWTFHPGDPIAPSQIHRRHMVKVTDARGVTSEFERDRDDQRARLPEARSLGVEWVKLA